MANVSSIGQAGQTPELPKQQTTQASHLDEQSAVDYFDNQYLNQLAFVAKEPNRR